MVVDWLIQRVTLAGFLGITIKHMQWDTHSTYQSFVGWWNGYFSVLFVGYLISVFCWIVWNGVVLMAQWLCMKCAHLVDPKFRQNELSYLAKRVDDPGRVFSKVIYPQIDTSLQLHYYLYLSIHLYMGIDT